MNGFAKGLKAPFGGVRFLLNHGSLLRFFAVPVLINTILYSAGAYLFFSRLSALLHWIFGDPSTWYMKAAFYAVGTVIAGVFALFLVFTFTAIALVIAGPFLDTLSRKVDEIRLGYDPAPPEISALRGASTAVLGQLKKIVLFLLLQGALLLVYLIPAVGQIAGAPLQIGVTFYFLAWEFFDFPMDRRGMAYARKKEFLSGHRLEALSFGAVCGLYMLVPLLNFIMIPASVAGATILVSELLGEKPKNEPET